MFLKAVLKALKRQQKKLRMSSPVITKLNLKASPIETVLNAAEHTPIIGYTMIVTQQMNKAKILS